MVVSSPYHCLTLSLLIFPLLLLATYLMAAFPGPPQPVHVHSSLASLPRTEKSWSIYPEDFYPSGGYAEFPNGKVRGSCAHLHSSDSHFHIFRLDTGFSVLIKVKRCGLAYSLAICPHICLLGRPHSRPFHPFNHMARRCSDSCRTRLSRVGLWCVRACLVDRAFLMPHLDLYGRGYSDAPQAIYDSSLYTTQLAFLMQYLRWDKANIVGLSMGGGIAAAFTNQFPHLVDEAVALIASAGIMEVDLF